MPLLRSLMLLAAGLALVPTATAQAPVIGKPRPAPPLKEPITLPPAVYDGTLAIEGEDIAARKTNTRMTVEVKLNGTGPYRFLVDSGADTSVVGLKVAQNLQLPLGTPVVLNGMTARNIVDRVKVAELTLGSNTLRHVQLPALREEHLGGDGMIGIDALRSQRLMMDFEKKTIRVEDATVPLRTLPGEIVVTAQRRKGQLILTEVRTSGLKLEAVIDTGTEVTIGNSALREKLVRKTGKTPITVATTGVTGVTVDLEMAVIPELRLGPITLYNVPIAFADVPPFQFFGLSKEPALLLGTDMLDTFRRVSLDFKDRKVRFQLKKCGTSSLVLSTSLHQRASRITSTGSADVCGR